MGVISCEELAGRIDAASTESERADLVICDVRFSLTDYEQGRREYEHSHLPGARYVDLHLDLADPSGNQSGRHPLPSMRDFGFFVARLGITPDTQVVAYDAAGGAMAARLWWMLRAIGHQNVQVLDGGWPAWVERGLPVSDEVPKESLSGGDQLAYRAGDQWPGVVSAADVEAVVAEADPTARPVLIDARAPERFRGEVEPLDARAGHIPGAINLFNGLNLGPDGLHRTVAELREIYASLLDTNDVIMYCGSGVAACHNLLMLHLLGHDSGRLYAGSWSDWSADPARPGATGDGT
jgi:thiosulfate/3-mercaptopyruvate sulfurtransferase